MKLYLILSIFIIRILEFSNGIYDCDKSFYSHDSKQGNFTTPMFPDKFPQNMQCLYRFIGGKHEKVIISWSEFAFGGNMPECLHAYVDVYLEIKNDKFNLLDEYLDDRICGNEIPENYISLHNILVLGLFSDSVANEKGFSAKYQFINAAPYHIGQRDPTNFCGYTISQRDMKSGTIYSPTYPSLLTPNLNCYWKFIGVPGQRIKLNFTNIHVEFGGNHCPYDSIKIYDEIDESGLLISNLCGTLSNKVIYSSSHNIFIRFTTKESLLQNKTGFTMDFVFDKNIVDLDFISSPGYHIIGTECDQQILSLGETNGTLFSPMYPMPYRKNLDCFYYLKGLKDRDNLEKMSLTFQTFDVPNNDTTCQYSYVGIYYKIRDHNSPPDERFCNSKRPPIIFSKSNLLLIRIHSSGLVGNGFKIWYDFDTDFGIPGTPHPEKSKCDFTFNSISQREGTFNSPRHPANYPINSLCLYTFKVQPREIIRLTFETFELPPKTLSDDMSPFDNNYLSDLKRCNLDSVKIFYVWEDERVELIGIFCGIKSPYPIQSQIGVNAIIVEFNATSQETTEGFSTQYAFLSQSDADSECNNNYSSSSTLRSGIVKTPNYPYKYQVSLTCDWFIKVRPGYRVLLVLTNFVLEGRLETGCSGAALLIWTNLTIPPAYVCGSSLPTNITEYLSDTEVMKIRFISSKKATGSKGFRASWTEVKTNATTCERGFLCQKNNYCIDSSLRCNHMKNCGSEDDSDEKYCSKRRKNYGQNIEISISARILYIMIIHIINFINK